MLIKAIGENQYVKVNLKSVCLDSFHFTPITLFFSFHSQDFFSISTHPIPKSIYNF